MTHIYVTFIVKFTMCKSKTANIWTTTIVAFITSLWLYIRLQKAYNDCTCIYINTYISRVSNDTTTHMSVITIITATSTTNQCHSWVQCSQKHRYKHICPYLGCSLPPSCKGCYRKYWSLETMIRAIKHIADNSRNV